MRALRLAIGLAIPAALYACSESGSAPPPKSIVLELEGNGTQVVLNGSPKDSTYVAKYDVKDVKHMTVTIAPSGDITAICRDGVGLKDCMDNPFFTEVRRYNSRTYVRVWDIFGRQLAQTDTCEPDGDAGNCDPPEYPPGEGGTSDWPPGSSSGGSGGSGSGSGGGTGDGWPPGSSSGGSGGSGSGSGGSGSGSGGSSSGSGGSGSGSGGTGDGWPPHDAGCSSGGSSGGSGSGSGSSSGGHSGSGSGSGGSGSGSGGSGSGGSSGGSSGGGDNPPCDPSDVAVAQQKFCAAVDQWLQQHGINYTLNCSMLNGHFDYSHAHPPQVHEDIPCMEIIKQAWDDVHAEFSSCGPDITSIIINWKSSSRWDLIHHGTCRGSPLVLDLDGDGVNLSSLEQGVPFDLLGTGERVQTAWPAAGDAWLTLDRNGNGAIDGAGEMFGNMGGHEDGFAALAELDANDDGVVDAKDPAFAELTVWRDANRDGVSQPNELRTLGEVGVKALLLAAKRNDGVTSWDSHGNQVPLVGQFVRTDGTRGLVADAWVRFKPIK